jgi:hypothetical protein
MSRDTSGTTPRRRGRPRVVTPETVARVEAFVAKGHSISNACRLAGVDRRTWYRHLGRATR